MKKVLSAVSLALPFFMLAQSPTCDFEERNINWSNPGQVTQVISRLTEDSTTLLKIPVVVHILHLKNPIGTVYNPTETTIKEIIGYLNQSFRATWPSYPDTLNGGTDLRIEFVLATKDTSGRPFNGINRIDESGNKDYAQLGRIGRDLLLATMWNKYKYFNIWVVHKIEGGGTGFAAGPEPPNAPIFNYEGAVIAAFNFKVGDPIVVHEAGHYFGLMHTWAAAFGNTCPVNNNCETDNDFICDTEPHSEKASCSLIGSINPCTGLPYGNTLKNFMSYSAAQCLDRFTRLQKKRMRLTTQSLRPGIANNELTVQGIVTLKELNGFKVLPNPNNGTFTIYFIAPISGKLSVSILNNSGQLVFRKLVDANGVRELPVSVSSLQSGIYFISIRDGSGTLTNRILIR